MPISEVASTGKAIWRLAERALQSELTRLIHGQIEVRIESDTRAIIYVHDEDIAAIVGRGGSNVRDLEKRIGLSLDIRGLDEWFDAQNGEERDGPSGQRYGGRGLAPRKGKRVGR